MMATWKDLDNESGSKKDEAEEEGNVALENEALGLVATEVSEATSEVGPPSEAELETDSKYENEVVSKSSRIELPKSLKELLSHFEHITNEMKDLKEKYVDLLKQHENTLLDLNDSKKEL